MRSATRPSSAPSPTVRPGGGLILVAPHDPNPLLAKIEQHSPGVFKVDYLERGPEAWRLSFAR